LILKLQDNISLSFIDFKYQINQKGFSIKDEQVQYVGGLSEGGCIRE